MAQQFSSDARGDVTGVIVNVPADTFTEIIRTAALVVPFETAKAKVFALCTYEPHALATQVVVELVRNPESDNVVIAVGRANLTPAAGQQLQMVIGGVDEIPGPQDVVYQLIFKSVTDAAEVFFPFIESTLLSG